MFDSPPSARLGSDLHSADRPSLGSAICWPIVAWALLLPGCGGSQVDKLDKDVAALKEEVAEMRRGQAAQRVQFDSFRNRLVMLQDRLESERVAAARRRSLGGDSRFGATTPAAEPPLLRQVVVPSAQPPAPVAPEPAARAVTIGPDGVVREERPPRAGAGSSAHKAEDKAGASERAAAKARLKPAGPRSAARDRPPTDEPSPDEVAAGEYREAKSMLDTGRLRDARQRFEAFLRAHPQHDLADNALYWTGETWYAQAMWLKAARSFGEVVGRYPNGNKVPDAMLKTGLCYRKVGEERLATEVFEQLRDLYPGTPAARLAEVHLAQMGGKR